MTNSETLIFSYGIILWIIIIVVIVGFIYALWDEMYNDKK